MKQLHIIRHAKSSWKDTTLDDRDRPLNKRGIRACALMAARIEAAGCDWVNIHTSPARRALQTIEGLAAALPEKSLQWSVDEDIYTFAGQDLLDWCHALPENHDTVVLVGHNPALSDLIRFLSGEDMDEIPTCAYARLRLPASRWKDVAPAPGSLEALIYPRMFDGRGQD